MSMKTYQTHKKIHIYLVTGIRETSKKRQCQPKPPSNPINCEYNLHNNFKK